MKILPKLLLPLFCIGLAATASAQADEGRIRCSYSSTVSPSWGVGTVTGQLDHRVIICDAWGRVILSMRVDTLLACGYPIVRGSNVNAVHPSMRDVRVDYGWLCAYRGYIGGGTVEVRNTRNELIDRDRLQ